MKLYVDGELLDRLAVAAATPAGRQVQRQLFIDAAVAIAFAAQRRFRAEPALGLQHVDDFRGSLVHKLTELVAGKGTDPATSDRRQIELPETCDDPRSSSPRSKPRAGSRRTCSPRLGPSMRYPAHPVSD